MAEWLLNRSMRLLESCEAFGSGRFEIPNEIMLEVDRIEKGCRELLVVGKLLGDCESLQDTLFSDDPCGMLDLAMSTIERVRLSLELFKSRRHELAVAHKAVYHIVSRDFHIAVLYRCGSSLKSEDRETLRLGFQRALAIHTTSKVAKRVTEINARPGDGIFDPTTSRPPGVRPANEISNFARLLDRSEVTELFVTHTCTNLNENSRGVLKGVIDKVFREFSA